MDGGARVFGLRAYGAELEKKGGGEEGGCLEGEGEEEGAAAEGVEGAREVDEEKVAEDKDDEGDEGFGPAVGRVGGLAGDA